MKILPSRATTLRQAQRPVAPTLKNRLLFFALGCLLVIAGCEKAPINPIPDYRVNVQLDLTYHDRDLYGPFTYKIITPNSPNHPHPDTEWTGFGGILVAHGLELEFFAYDLACPHEIQLNIRVEITDGGLRAKCPECGSVYDIMGGGARISGPSAYSLKRYRIVPNGDNRLIVYN